MVHHAVTHARNAAGSAVFLEVWDSNAAAKKLYLSQGFHILHRRRGYYRRGEIIEDAVVMKRELKHPPTFAGR